MVVLVGSRILVERMRSALGVQIRSPASIAKAHRASVARPTSNFGPARRTVRSRTVIVAPLVPARRDACLRSTLQDPAREPAQARGLALGQEPDAEDAPA